MKTIILTAGLLIASVSAQAEKMYLAGYVQGLQYNETVKRVYKKDLNVWVAPNQLQVEGDGSLGGSFVDFDADVMSRSKQFSDIVAKAIKWAEIAKTNKAKVAKTVGIVEDKGSVSFDFISSDNAETIMLVVRIRDWDSQFKKSDIILSSIDQMKQLKAVFDKAPATLKDAQKAKENEALFN